MNKLKTAGVRDDSVLRVKDIIKKVRKRTLVGAAVAMAGMSDSTFYRVLTLNPELRTELTKARAESFSELFQEALEDKGSRMKALERGYPDFVGRHRENDIMLNLPEELQAQLLDESRSGQLKMSYLTTAYLANNITQHQFEKTLLAIKLAHPDIQADENERMFNIKVELPENGRSNTRKT